MRFILVLTFVVLCAAAMDAQERLEYRVIATSKTSTMQKEMQEAGDEGFEYRGQTVFKSTFGGKEVIAILERAEDGKSKPKYEYRLLASKKTSTMQKELLEASEAGYEFRAQTVFETTFGGKEVVAILEKDRQARSGGFVYKLLATTRTSTMEKELKAAGEEGYEVVGLAVGQTAVGGKEIVTITRKKGE